MQAPRSCSFIRVLSIAGRRSSPNAWMHWPQVTPAEILRSPRRYEPFAALLRGECRRRIQRHAEAVETRLVEVIRVE